MYNKHNWEVVMKGLTITLPKVELITKLTAKREEWAGLAAELSTELDTMTNTADGLKEWYIEVGERLKAGTLAVNGRDQLTVVNGGDNMAEKPSAGSIRSSKERLRQALKRVGTERTNHFEYYNRLTEMLGLATDEMVTVEVWEYQKALAQQVDRDRWVY
jgi:hypothetical protein